jgi:hypothetical protein
LEKISESLDNQWRRLDLRVPLVPVGTPVVKDLAETTELMVDPDYRVFQDPQDPQARPRPPLIWTRSLPSLLRETKQEVAPLVSDSCRLKWARWDPAVPRDPPDPQVPSGSSVLAVTPEIRDR